MFVLTDDPVPIALLRRWDAPLALAQHFRIRPKGWGEVGFGVGVGSTASEMAMGIAVRLAQSADLSFVKLDVIFPSSQSPEKDIKFRERLGLDPEGILRRPVVGEAAVVEDWAALFAFAMDFGWDAVAFSRRKNALVWFSHDAFLRATPPALVRGM